MALGLFLLFLTVSVLVAFRDWRRGWIMIILCGAVQDPVRKLTPGTPVLISFLVLILYAAVLFSARHELRANLHEFSRRFSALAATGLMFLFFLFVAAVNGFLTFGLANWKVPLLSLFTYVAPLPALFVGYTFLQREEMLYRFFRIYAIATSLALVGTALEYFRVQLPVLGLVGAQYEYWRHLGGIQVRLLSGFYRGPDIMAWHAATLSAIAIAMAVRAGFGRRGTIWAMVAGGAFTACLLSGRRKAVYYVVAFCLVFLWRYFRRLTGQRVMGMAIVAVIALTILFRFGSAEGTSIYTRGARTTRAEIITRITGGVSETIQQSGVMGAGLGMATQGTRHLVGDTRLGWQEGGLAKLTVELGVPGLIAALILLLRVIRVSFRLTAIGDVPGSSQFARVMLFALMIANGASFLASAQAYTDAILGLLTAFFGGCLFAMATLDERLAAEEKARAGGAGRAGALQPATA